MPTYQYSCTECGHQLEAVQSFTDDPLTECPNCGGKLRKQFSAVGIVFKGSGFYRTDSRSTSSAGAGANGSGKDKEKKETPAAKSGDGGSKSDSTSKDSTSKSTSSSDTGTSSNGSSSKKPVGTSS